VELIALLIPTGVYPNLAINNKVPLRAPAYYSIYIRYWQEIMPVRIELGRSLRTGHIKQPGPEPSASRDSSSLRGLPSRGDADGQSPVIPRCREI
jgi:hypothetical protein